MTLCPCHCPNHCESILEDDEDFFEFRNVPYNSWIPSTALGLASITVGAVLIYVTSAQLWFVTLVLWTVAGVVLAKVKYARYTFDKKAGTVMITKRCITGTRVKVYSLSNIIEIVYEKERDLQGGDDVQIFMKLENGKEIKLLAGHFCGIRGKLKKLLKRKLDAFLQSIPAPHIHRVKKEVKIQEDSSVVSSSEDSDSESYTSSEQDKSHRIKSSRSEKSESRRSKGRHHRKSDDTSHKDTVTLTIIDKDKQKDKDTTITVVSADINTSDFVSADPSTSVNDPDDVVIPLSGDL